jgi:hypothetical protein
MNKPVIFGIVAIALVVCVAALFLVGPRKPATPPANSTGAATSTSAADASENQIRSATPSGTASAPNAPSSRPPTNDLPATPRPPTAIPASAPEPGDADNPSEELFLSDDEIAAAIQEKGGVVPVYAGASASHRQDIIDYLMAEEQLRDNLPALLPLETDTALRAYMLERTIPKGYFDDAKSVPMGTDLAGGTGEASRSPDTPETAFDASAVVDDASEAASAAIDGELQALLDQTPSTPINADEWLARLDLALMTDDAFGLAWARKAREEASGDVSVQALAASILLNLAQGDSTITDDEQQRAQQILTDSLASAGSAGTIDPNQRIRAYYALYFAPERVEARDFLTKQRALETDPRALQTLNQLLERWDQGGGNPGSPGGQGG